MNLRVANEERCHRNDTPNGTNTRSLVSVAFDVLNQNTPKKKRAFWNRSCNGEPSVNPQPDIQGAEMPASYSLEELAWFHRDGSMDATLTALTSLPESEFERWMFLIRQARAFGS